MASKQVVIRKKPRSWSVGLFVAGLIAVVYYRVTDGFTWWMLVLCIIVSFLVDWIVYGRTSRKGVYIEDKL